MDKLQSKEQNLRLDHNLGFHIDKFKNYPDDGELIKSLIIYMSFNFQKNLFGQCTLDPSHFAMVMNHGEENLKRKHPNPIYHTISGRSKEESQALEKKHGRISKYRILDSRIENALLIMRYEKTLETYLTKDHFADVISLRDFKYIEELDVVIVKTGKTKKLKYIYKLNDNFERSLKKFFFNANIETYKSLKGNRLKLGDCYLHLMSRISTESAKGNNKIFYNIKEFATLMNISTDKLDEKNAISDPEEKAKNKAFSKLKNRINVKFKEKFKPRVEKEISQLELIWVKGAKANYFNVPVIRWKNITKEKAETRNKLIYDDIFYTEYVKDLSEYYYNNYEKLTAYDENLSQRFLNWMLCIKDYDIKVSKYVSNYVDCKGKHDDVQSRATKFCTRIKSIGKVNSIEKIIYIKNDVYILLDQRNNKEIHYHQMKDLLFALNEFYPFFEDNYRKQMMK